MCYRSVPQNTEVGLSVTTLHQARVPGLWVSCPEEESQNSTDRTGLVTVQEVQSLDLPVQACLEKGITQGLFPWIKTEEVSWNLLNIFPEESK